jgi:hypothetical protein
MQLKLNVIWLHSMDIHVQLHDSLLNTEIKIPLNKILTRTIFTEHVTELECNVASCMGFTMQFLD